MAQRLSQFKLKTLETHWKLMAGYQQRLVLTSKHAHSLLEQ